MSKYRISVLDRGRYHIPANERWRWRVRGNEEPDGVGVAHSRRSAVRQARRDIRIREQITPEWEEA